jgi:hypothetical protein
MHPRTKRHIKQIIKPLARLVAGYGILILLAILAILALIILP